ncbi:BTAD domain-containing putative transcriptional regulator [Streptomyces nigra]|uniref:ATP-binding protein n=1 Tax=Streptomyces nigra TaxID=1827580 RepID=UPI003451765E
MRFRLLGPPEMTSGDGLSLQLAGQLRRSLAVRLLLGRGLAVPRDVLIDDLWAQRPANDPVNALQVQVTKLRAAFAAAGEAGRIPGGAGGYCLLLREDDEIDVDVFEQKLRQGRADLHAGRYADAERTLASALSLWRGRPLEGLTGLHFQGERSRLRELRLSVVDAWADACLALGRAHDTVTVLSQITNDDPLHEDARRRFMVALYRIGRQPEALQVFEEGRRQLSTRLGVDPSPALQTLADAMRRQDVSLFHEVPQTAPRYQVRRSATPKSQARPALAPREGNFVRPLGPFIGRREELESLCRRMRTDRLVSVTGPGGVGKTRLALEACDPLDPDFAALWWVDLSASDTNGVAAATVVALGLTVTGALPGTASYDQAQQIAAALASRRTLLIFDNCEHVLDGAAPLIQSLLTRCPELTIVVTSREPLSLPGEVLHELGPMPVNDSVTHFTVRAQMINPDFRVDAGMRSHLETLARRLEGLPLAVELAVPYVQVLTPQEIVSKLDDRFAFLNRGFDRTAPHRHRTLRAVLDWSYALLGVEERTLLGNLSEFVGGCRLDGADRLELLPGADETEVLHVLSQLVQKSLLTIAHDNGGTRIQMLETVREYAQYRLDTGGMLQDAEHLLITWALSFTASAVTGLQSAEQAHWIQQVSEENANLRAAARLLHTRCRPVDALILEARLGYFWFVSGREEEGIERLAQALERYEPHAAARKQPPTHIEEWAFYYCVAWLAWLNHVIGRHQQARKYGALNGGYWRRAGNPDLTVLGPCYDALFAMLSAEKGVDQLFAQAHEAVIGTAFHWDHANLCASWAIYSLHTGDVAAAQAHGKEASQAAEMAGDACSQAFCLVICGDADESVGHHDAAREQWSEAADIFRTIGARGRLASVLLRLAYYELYRGSAQTGHHILEEAQILAASLTAGDLLAATSNLHALLYLREGDMGTAGDLFRRVWDAPDATPLRKAVAGIGMVAASQKPDTYLVEQLQELHTQVLEPLAQGALVQMLDRACAGAPFTEPDPHVSVLAALS